MPRQKINFIALKLCEPAEFDKKFQTASFTESSTGDPAMAINCVTSLHTTRQGAHTLT